ncbi:MAG: hypothetical protein KGH53_03265 [Candidatus Micrarchaeota archaeon]|nr:hypothetical protein [Candidatus Micrarchaeota archaeon]
MTSIFEGAKRFIIIIVALALLGYGSLLYNNVYGVGISSVLIIIALILGARAMNENRQRVLTIKKPLK